MNRKKMSEPLTHPGGEPAPNGGRRRSYGGFLAATLHGRPHPFKALIVLAAWHARKLA